MPIHLLEPACRALGLKQRRWLLPLALVMVLAACGGGGRNGGNDTSGGAAQGFTRVGPGGATVLAADGASLTIPTEALLSDIEVSMARDDDRAQILAAGQKPAGELFALQPHGQIFAQPVTVRLPFDPSTLGADERPVVLKTSTEGAWDLIEDVRIEGRMLAFEVSSFSWVRILAVPTATALQPRQASNEQPSFEERPEFCPLLPGGPWLCGLPVPEKVLFRSPRVAFNSSYVAVLSDDGQIYLRHRLPQDGTLWGGWEVLKPAEGLGRPVALSMDDQTLVAVDGQGRFASIGRDFFSLGYSIFNGTIVNPLPIRNIALTVLEAARASEYRGMNRLNPQEINLLVNWSTDWGAPLGSGAGHQLPPGTLAWSLSVVSQFEDGYYHDAAGVVQNVGGAGCTTVFALYDGGRRIALIDPWLPNDYSYEVGLPEKGHFVAQGMSASGSTLFIIGPDGRMWVRRHDFDMSGSDTAFFPASFHPRNAPLFSGKGAMDTVILGTSRSKDKAAHLPGLVRLAYIPDRIRLSTRSEPWIAQPTINTLPGEVLFDGISIHKKMDGAKVALGVDRRILRVPAERWDGNERVSTGYYEREISINCALRTGPCSSPETSWSGYIEYEYPGGKVPGRRLGSHPALDFTPSSNTEPLQYAGSNGRMTVSINDFRLYHSPATVSLWVDNRRFDMPIHYFDGMRQVTTFNATNDTRGGPNFGREVDGQARTMYGTIMLTDQVVKAVDEAVKSNFLGTLPAGLVSLMGAMRGTCRPGETDIAGVACLPACPADHDTVLGACVRRCPAGWSQDLTGLLCVKPGSYLRPGYFLDPARCQANHGACEELLGTWYPRTQPGYYCVGPVCALSSCPNGMGDFPPGFCTKTIALRDPPRVNLPRAIPYQMRLTADKLELQVDTDFGPQGPVWTLTRIR